MRAALPVFLFLAAGSAWADLVRVSEGSDTIFYVDPDSIGDQGGFRRVAVMEDNAKPEAGAARSRRVWYEIDCPLERLRRLSATDYSEPMGQGAGVVSLEGESTWFSVAAITGSNIPPRTPYRQIVRFVCSR